MCSDVKQTPLETMNVTQLRWLFYVCCYFLKAVSKFLLLESTFREITQLSIVLLNPRNNLDLNYWSLKSISNCSSYSCSCVFTTIHTEAVSSKASQITSYIYWHYAFMMSVFCIHLYRLFLALGSYFHLSKHVSSWKWEGELEQLQCSQECQLQLKAALIQVTSKAWKDNKSCMFFALTFLLT